MAGPPRRVTIVGFPDVELLDVACPADVLDAANRHGARPPYEIRLATIDGQAIRTCSGLILQPHLRLDQVAGDLDTLIVAGGWGSTTAASDERVLAHLRRLAQTSRRIASVCTGAEVLAAAGLLDGRRATTHWAWGEALAGRHPAVLVERDRIFVRDGNVATSAGVTAGMDLALALVEEDHGAEVARTIARWMVLFLQRPGGQSQFSERLEPPGARTAAVRALLDSIVSDPAADHRLEHLATRAAMSERHLMRRFSAE